MATDDPVSAPKAPRFLPLPGSMAAAAAWPIHRLFLQSERDSDVPYSKDEIRAAQESVLVPATCLADLEAKARALAELVIHRRYADDVTGPIGSDVPPVTDDMDWDQKVALSLLADIARLNREAA